MLAVPGPFAIGYVGRAGWRYDFDHVCCYGSFVFFPVQVLMKMDVGVALMGHAMNIEDRYAHHGSGSMNLVLLHLDCLFKCNWFLLCVFMRLAVGSCLVTFVESYRLCNGLRAWDSPMSIVLHCFFFDIFTEVIKPFYPKKVMFVLNFCNGNCCD